VTRHHFPDDIVKAIEDDLVAIESSRQLLDDLWTATDHLRQARKQQKQRFGLLTSAEAKRLITVKGKVTSLLSTSTSMTASQGPNLPTGPDSFA
jgi:hypothetical protein